YTKLIDFDGASNGSIPNGSLVYANNGKLYGMTSNGGNDDLGVIFSYDPGTSTFTKLVDLDGRFKGSNPWGDLMQASNGKLYGMTSDGGNGTDEYGSAGVLFSYDPVANVYAKKFD